LNRVPHDSKLMNAASETVSKAGEFMSSRIAQLSQPEVRIRLKTDY
jgi:hypothetical protein